MKESLTDITLLLTIDHTAQYSHASSKSMSLELLLHLHTLVGAVELRRTNRGSSPGRPRCAPSSGLQQCTAVGTVYGLCTASARSSREQVVSVGGFLEQVDTFIRTL